jgi:hypothetical protein
LLLIDGFKKYDKRGKGIKFLLIRKVYKRHASPTSSEEVNTFIRALLFSFIYFSSHHQGPPVLSNASFRTEHPFLPNILSYRTSFPTKHVLTQIFPSYPTDLFNSSNTIPSVNSAGDPSNPPNSIGLGRRNQDCFLPDIVYCRRGEHEGYSRQSRSFTMTTTSYFPQIRLGRGRKDHDCFLPANICCRRGEHDCHSCHFSPSPSLVSSTLTTLVLQTRLDLAGSNMSALSSRHLVLSEGRA